MELIDIQTKDVLRDYYNLTTTWKQRAQGLMDVKIYTANPNDVYYVALARNLTHTSALKYRIAKVGSNGTQSLSIRDEDIALFPDNIVTKGEYIADGTYIEATVNFNMIGTSWSGIGYDQPADIVMVVSRSMYYPVRPIPKSYKNAGTNTTLDLSSAQIQKVQINQDSVITLQNQLSLVDYTLLVQNTSGNAIKFSLAGGIIYGNQNTTLAAEKTAVVSLIQIDNRFIAAVALQP
ncbi:MAG: hypothetical protein QHC79_14905 [Pseudosphingobacterium sp.]|nr:hypothetical protein [Pseudosphingobacterium sp.]